MTVAAVDSLELRGLSLVEPEAGIVPVVWRISMLQNNWASKAFVEIRSDYPWLSIIHRG